MATENSIINLGDLSKPATALIEKIAEAVGGIFLPYQITRTAKAEAEANLIRANSEIQVTDLHRRAMHRFVMEESIKQANIEAISQKAIPLLEENSSPQNIENDWISNFFNKSRLVSHSGMQELWAKVLAGEANTPGTFSKKTVNLIADLEKDDAKLFICLCGFTWKIHNEEFPIILDYDAPIYDENAITFNSLIHLENLGLIQFSHPQGFVLRELPQVLETKYFEKSLQFVLPKGDGNELDIGTVLFTRAGHELSTICGAQPVNDFFEYAHQLWIEKISAQKDEIDSLGQVPTES